MLPVISLLAFCLTFAVVLVVAYEKNLANDGCGERVGGVNEEGEEEQCINLTLGLTISVVDFGGCPVMMMMFW